MMAALYSVLCVAAEDFRRFNQLNQPYSHNLRNCRKSGIGVYGHEKKSLLMAEPAAGSHCDDKFVLNAFLRVQEDTRQQADSNQVHTPNE